MKRLIVPALIVLVIIGMIAGFTGNDVIFFRELRNRLRLWHLDKVVALLEDQREIDGRYPASRDGKIVHCGLEKRRPCEWGNAFIIVEWTFDFHHLPGDPKRQEKAHYYYWASPQGYSYQLYARLEGDTAETIPVNAQGEPLYYSGTNCGSGLCNYGLSSSQIDPAAGRRLVEAE